MASPDGSENPPDCEARSNREICNAQQELRFMEILNLQLPKKLIFHIPISLSKFAPYF